ncbi:MAG: DUF47 family protein [Chloroflexota bacterium]|nr:DUF47 family protein [Chloroflexota bacterium]
MPFSLVPTERQFFVLFRENATNLMEGLKVLNTLLNSSADQFAHHHTRLRDLEHRGDEITHRVHQELNQTFLTPFDREDIYALAGAVDDVIDLAEETAATIVLDRVDEISPEAQELGAILLELGQQLVEAFDHLESRKDPEAHWVRIHELENEGDRVSRQAIGNLFQHSQDPIHIIKWKDVYNLLEQTIDRTEDVANILETVTLKNA